MCFCLLSCVVICWHMCRCLFSCVVACCNVLLFVGTCVALCCQVWLLAGMCCLLPCVAVHCFMCCYLLPHVLVLMVIFCCLLSRVTICCFVFMLIVMCCCSLPCVAVCCYVLLFITTCCCSLSCVAVQKRFLKPWFDIICLSKFCKYSTASTYLLLQETECEFHPWLEQVACLSSVNNCATIYDLFFSSRFEYLTSNTLLQVSYLKCHTCITSYFILSYFKCHVLNAFIPCTSSQVPQVCYLENLISSNWHHGPISRIPSYVSRRKCHISSHSQYVFHFK